VPWRDALTPDDVAILRQQIACFAPPSLTDAQIETVLTAVLQRPTPLEANQIAYQRCASAGYAARDDIVKRAAERYGLTAAYLETPRQAGDAPRALAMTVGAAVSAQAVHFALSPAALNAQADLVDALNAGDYQSAAAAVDRSLAGAGINPTVFDDIHGPATQRHLDEDASTAAGPGRCLYPGWRRASTRRWRPHCTAAGTRLQGASRERTFRYGYPERSNGRDAVS
jgi:hypothetical protein